ADGCASTKSLPPVSPTIRGYERYLPMFVPIVFHIELKTPVEPVKCTPARSSWFNTVSEIIAASAGRKLITPGGIPAASNSLYVYHELSTAVVAGFQSTVLPMSAGDDERLPPIAVKLNGVTANTNPSSARYSLEFHIV